MIRSSSSLASQSLDNVSTRTPPRKQRNDFYLHVRSASGGEEKDCFCFSDDKVGRGAGDLRLGCMCLVHYHCLVSYIRSSLGDKSRLMQVLNTSDDDQTTGIPCPYYSPHGNQCKFSGVSAISLNSFSTESVDRYESSKSIYFLTIEDLENLVTFGLALKNHISQNDSFHEGNQLQSLPLTKEEVQKLKNWLSEGYCTHSPARLTPIQGGTPKFGSARLSRKFMSDNMRSASSRDDTNFQYISSSQSGDSRSPVNQRNLDLVPRILSCEYGGSSLLTSSVDAMSSQSSPCSFRSPLSLSNPSICRQPEGMSNSQIKNGCFCNNQHDITTSADFIQLGCLCKANIFCLGMYVSSQSTNNISLDNGSQSIQCPFYATNRCKISPPYLLSQYEINHITNFIEVPPQ